MTKKAPKRNVNHLARSLEKRVQRARQIPNDTLESASLLWSVWEDSSRFPELSKQFWSSGRDAAIITIATGDRTNAVEWLHQLLQTLQRHAHFSAEASTLNRVIDLLNDGEILDLVGRLDPPPTATSLLSGIAKARLIDIVEEACSEGSRADLVNLLGRLIRTSSSEPQIAIGDVSDRSVQARTLRLERWHGTETAAGIAYEAGYALWRYLTEPHIQSVDLQDLEDICFVHQSLNEPAFREHVQVKKRDNGWTIPALQGRSSGANKVFDSFAEALIAEPDAHLTFATDSQLNLGKAPILRVATDFVEWLVRVLSSTSPSDLSFLQPALWRASTSIENKLYLNLEDLKTDDHDLVRIRNHFKRVCDECVKHSPILLNEVGPDKFEG